MKSIYKFIFTILLISHFNDGFAQTIPTYTIAQVRGSNGFEGGMADSTGKKCKITGIVYGENFRASSNGITFSLKDQTGWIGLFRDNSNFGITLLEGDSIRAIGTVTGFNGLSQISLDSIKVLGSNRPLVLPQVVTTLNESTESRLVKLVGWSIINPAEWTSGAGSGFTVRINKGIDTIDLRIDNDCQWLTNLHLQEYWILLGLVVNLTLPYQEIQATSYFQEGFLTFLCKVLH